MLDPPPLLPLELDPLLGVAEGVLLVPEDDPLSLDFPELAESPEEAAFPSELPEEPPSDAPLREAAVEPAFP